MIKSIPVILSTGSLFNFDVATVMALAAETGYDGVELMVDWRRETHDVQHLRRLARQHRVPILAVHSPFVRMTFPGWPNEPVASIQRSVQLAESVGARTVVVHPPGRWLRLQGLVSTPHHTRKISLPLPLVGPGPLGRWLERDLPAFQAKTPVKVAVENMPCRRVGPLRLEPYHFSDPSRLVRFQHLTFDTTHVGTRGLDLLQFYEQLEAQVCHIHLSNFNGREHQLPDNGHLPLRQLLARLKQRNFTGLVSLELNPYSLQSEDRLKLKQNLKRSLRYCRQALQPEPSVRAG